MPTAVCLGETMAMLTPESGVTLDGATTLHVGIGGAESNVAVGFASMGLDAHWVSRVGRDGFGDRILSELASHGVGLSGVEIDSSRPTGLYVKLPRTATAPASVLYYRRGSAASAMTPALLDEPHVAALLGKASLIHVSGITAALSEDSLAFLEAVLNRTRSESRVSFDVNWRPTLWEGRDRSVLRSLANRADIVLVGKDEAEHALGTGDEAEIRALLPDPETVIVKNEATSAIALGRNGERCEVPSLTVDVVEPVGAGDAFAAGYLSGVILGLDQKASLRRGHVAAACTLVVPGDHGPLPAPPVLERILACTDETWAGAAVSSDGFSLDGHAFDDEMRLL
ncbi:sugar kinase [Sinomonas humi]|uniref:2-keto-3-deoxygluconate kinase n=1 Tax=Sinomonas humi TaxID=1338436 RepID=A0A0B2AJI0_9MICC|nr:sugar kinase [Sinomonas humi]KHL01917.1 2-keto-3-deoxygluconate kinase [Sinomonas humi]